MGTWIRGLALAAVAWGLINGYFMAAIADIGERDGFECTTGQPKASLVLVTGGIAAAAAFALGLSLSRHPRGATTAILAQVALSALWVALGGFDAYGCAVSI